MKCGSLIKMVLPKQSFCIAIVFSTTLLSAQNLKVGKEIPNSSKMTMSLSDYKDRCEAVWTAQIVSVLMGWEFEHKVASVEWKDKIDYSWSLQKLKESGGHAPLDDDWFYEMSSLFGFEKYGPQMTLKELGKQWLSNNVGTWGATAQARKNMSRGILPPDSGSPRYNRLWFTMGSQNRCDLYGMLNPGQPNQAAKMAREFSHICSYAEGSDGGTFMATLIALAFYEKDYKSLLKKSVQVLDKSTPHRKCLDMVISMAESGYDYKEVADAVMDRWQIEYPATNNTVANAGVSAIALWFGDGDFLKSLNIAFEVADYTDSDCNATAPATALAAMYGMAAIPKHLVAPLNGRVVGSHIGDIEVNPSIDIGLKELANRTARVGVELLGERGVNTNGDTFTLYVDDNITTQPAELFHPDEFVKWWNPDWVLERSGHGAPGGGHRGIRGGTFLDDGILSTYPRDEVRGLKLSQQKLLNENSELILEVGADAGRTWKLEVYVGHERVYRKLIDGGPALEWEGLPDTHYPPPQEDYQACKKIRKYERISIDLSKFTGKHKVIRLYQSTLVRNKFPGNAYWKSAEIF